MLAPLVAVAGLLALVSASPTKDRVLVVGADATLVHNAVASASTPADLASSFSPAGLAQLAMDALKLPTGSLVRLSSNPSDASQHQLLVQSPVQADVFKRVDAYAMVFIDPTDTEILTTLDASASSGFHKIFDLTTDDVAGSSTKIPTAIASALSNTVGARVQCAGTASQCGSLPVTLTAPATLDAVWTDYRFLDAKQSVDMAFAKEVAQTRQLVADLSSHDATPNALFAVNFDAVTTLSEDKQSKARAAIATEIKALLKTLQAKYPHCSGAQVVATSRLAEAKVVTQAKSISTSYAIKDYERMLLSFNEKIGSASLDDDDDDDDDDVVGVNGTKSDITMEDIAEYQIVLWTSVLLGAVLLLVIIAMCNMNNKRDSLLYAKFTTSNANRKYD